MAFPTIRNSHTPFVFAPGMEFAPESPLRTLGREALESLRRRPTWPRIWAAAEFAGRARIFTKRQLVRAALHDMRWQAAGEFVRRLVRLTILYRWGWREGGGREWTQFSRDLWGLGLDLGGARLLGWGKDRVLVPQDITEALGACVASEILSWLWVQGRRPDRWVALARKGEARAAASAAAGAAVYVILAPRGTDEETLEETARQMVLWREEALRARARAALLVVAERERTAQMIEERASGKLGEFPRLYSTDSRIMTMRPWERGAWLAPGRGGFVEVRLSAFGPRREEREAAGK